MADADVAEVRTHVKATLPRPRPRRLGRGDAVPVEMGRFDLPNDRSIAHDQRSDYRFAERPVVEHGRDEDRARHLG